MQMLTVICSRPILASNTSKTATIMKGDINNNIIATCKAREVSNNTESKAPIIITSRKCQCAAK